MKTNEQFSGKSRLVMLFLFSGLFFGTTGFSQDAAKDCACIKTTIRGDVMTKLNVSSYSTTHKNYTMLTDCEDGETCEGECTWAYDKPHEGWVIEHGTCEAWPKVKPADGVEIPGDRAVVESDGSISMIMEQISFYPNPSTGSIIIQADAAYVTTIIYNMAGEIVLKSTEKEIDTSQLKPGTYIISMNDGDYLRREQLVIL